MEKAVGYVRVSTEEQGREGVSLDAQEARIRAYAAMRGLDLVAVYREEGVSGRVPLGERPEGSKLVEAVARKRARHVIAVKLDRLFRSAEDALAMTARWDRARCALHVLDMGGAAVDTASAVGRMFLTVVAGMAEMERALISERTRAALAHKRAQGAVYTHITPLGFRRKGERLVADAREMATVRRIQEMRAAGLSLHKIADRLNEEGVPTKLGGRWYAVTVQKVLKIHAA